MGRVMRDRVRVMRDRVRVMRDRGEGPGPLRCQTQKASFSLVTHLSLW